MERPGALTPDRVLRDEVVRVAALTVTSTWITDMTFINCQIIGPAVLALVDQVDIDGARFEGDPHSIYWDVDLTRPTLLGAVGVRNVAFSQCGFQHIGFAGPAKLRTLLEQCAFAD